MRRDFNIPQSDFFRYLQVRNFVRTHFSLTAPQSTWIEECLNTNLDRRGVVSVLYDTIQRVSSPSLNHLARQWETELGITISDSDWHDAIAWVHSSSICIRHGLLQFKIIHRLHLSPKKLAKLYPEREATCSRCKHDSADLSHMFWGCPKLTPFWTAVFETFSYICNKNIDPNPLTALFGVVQRGVDISGPQTESIAFATLIARRMILLRWKKSAPPSHKAWVGEIMSHLKLEHLKYTARGSTQKYYTVWQPFLSYFENEFPTLG